MSSSPELLRDEQLILGVDVAPNGTLLWTVRRPASDLGTYEVNLWYQTARSSATMVATRLPIVGVGHLDASARAAVVLAGEPSQAWRIALDGGGERRLTNLPRGVVQAMPSPAAAALAVIAPWGRPRFIVGDPDRPVARRVPDPRFAADGYGFRDYSWRLLLADGGEIAALGVDGDDVEACGWSPDGRWLWYAARGNDPTVLGASHLWVVRACAGGERKLVACAPGTIVDASWADDGRLAYANHPAGDSTAAQLFVADPDGDTPRRLDRGWCVEHGGLLDTLPIAGSDIGQLCWNPTGDGVLATVSDHGSVRLFSFPVSAAFEPRVVADGLTPAAIRGRGAQVAIVGSCGRAGADVYRLDDQGEHRVTTHGSWLADEYWPTVRRLDLARPGNRALGAWLFEPADQPGGPVPLVVHIHGGPHQTHIGLPWLEMILMTERGYRVLCPDPTGSLGYGDAYSTGVHDRHGEPDLTDLVSCVDYAIDGELADPDRIAVMGMSYGGAATLRMLAADARPVTGIAENPYANLVSFLGTSDIAGAGDRLLGLDPAVPDLAGRLARSPIAGIERIRAPLLLLHAEGDLRCPISESEQIFTRLRALGRRAEFVRFPDESHLMFYSGRPDRRRYRLRVILDWLDEHLGGKPFVEG